MAWDYCKRAEAERWGQRMLKLNHIYHGNCLELMKEIDDESIDLVLTDPPYGINYQNLHTHKKHDILIGDNTKFSYKELSKEWFRVLKPDTALICFTGWSEYPHHFNEVENAGFIMKEPLICQKRPSGVGDKYGAFQPNSSWCIFAHKGNFVFKQTKILKNKRAGTIPNKGGKIVPEWKKRFPSCWFGKDYPYSTENPTFQKKNNVFHPTIKGLEFIKWLVQLLSDESDIVLDPFLGSGTTAIACINLFRQFIGIEKEAKYVETSKKRIYDEISKEHIQKFVERYK